jgi:predicted esterase
MRKYILIGLTALAVVLTSYYVFTKFEDKSEKVEDSNTRDNSEQIINPIVEEPPVKIYEETPADESGIYFEKTPVIGGQQAYIAHPMKINPDALPILIVYSHGSNTTVTTNFNDPFMKDLQLYGKYFTSKGYVFSASNQHGANDGNQASIDDTRAMIKWISEEYLIQEKVYMIGFSMGGRPTIYYTEKFPESVSKIAMLAPATCYCSPSLYNSLKGIPIKIWHGTSDVNVPYSAALEFIERAKPYGLDITLRTIEGAGHFDIDTEYIEEIYEFFEE